LRDNAGDIDTSYKDASLFNHSLYKEGYRQRNSLLTTILQLIDFIYIVGSIIIIIAFIRVVIKRVKELYFTRHLNFPWYNIIDIAVIALSWTSMCYWTIIFIAFDGVRLPIKGESHFQSVVDH